MTDEQIENQPFVKMMDRLIGAIGAMPECGRPAYEKLSKAFDKELTLYTDPGSKFKIFHQNCFEHIATLSKRLLVANEKLSLRLETEMTVEVIESHNYMLYGAQVVANHTPTQLAFNRAIWQGANACIAMIMCLRPKANDWMDVKETWTAAVGIIAASTAMLRVQREATDMGYADPDGPLTGPEWDKAYIAKEDRLVVAVGELLK